MFKDICIDSESTRISIAEMKQFRTLQRIVEINLNELIFNFDDIIFDIEITSSIDYIKLKIFLKIVNFHIVLIDISFLLSLTNMNKLRVYFNNFINEFV